jgi:hypothetical protein
MHKSLVLAAGASMAATAAAMAGPVTAHAQQTGPGSDGPCPSTGKQHTGPGHHSFTHSDNNCVNFANSSGTAYLTDSDFNLINMNGLKDTVRNFEDSNHNTINFFSGSNYDTVSADDANSNTLAFDKGASGDFVTLLGSNDNITIIGSQDFIIIGDSGKSSCLIFGNNIGLNGSPVTVTGTTVGTSGC